MYGTVCHSMLLKLLIITYLRLVWINFGLIRIVNICGKPTYLGPEVDQKYYVIMIRVYFRPLKKGVALPLAIVKKG